MCVSAHLNQALGASPVPLRNVVEGWDQTKGVVAVVTAVTQQQAVLGGPAATHPTHVLFHLGTRWWWWGVGGGVIMGAQHFVLGYGFYLNKKV